LFSYVHIILHYHIYHKFWIILIQHQRDKYKGIHVSEYTIILENITYVHHCIQDAAASNTQCTQLNNSNELDFTRIKVE